MSAWESGGQIRPRTNFIQYWGMAKNFFYLASQNSQLSGATSLLNAKLPKIACSRTSRKSTHAGESSALLFRMGLLETLAITQLISSRIFSVRPHHILCLSTIERKTLKQ